MEGSNLGQIYFCISHPTYRPETRHIPFINTESEVTTGKSQTSALKLRPLGLRFPCYELTIG